MPYNCLKSYHLENTDLYCKIIYKIRALKMVNGNLEHRGRRQCLHEISQHLVVIHLRHSFIRLPMQS